MDVDAKLLENSEFQRLMSRRSRWRWGVSGLLIIAYFVFGMGGVYFADAYSTMVFGTSIPAGIVAGNAIIVVSIVLSVYYVRVANKIEDEIARQLERQP